MHYDGHAFRKQPASAELGAAAQSMRQEIKGVTSKAYKKSAGSGHYHRHASKWMVELLDAL